MADREPPWVGSAGGQAAKMVIDPWRRYSRRSALRPVVSRAYGFACLACSWSEEICDMAHLTPKSNRLIDVVPLCPNCHRKMDSGRLSKNHVKRLQREKLLERLGIDIEEEG